MLRIMRNTRQCHVILVTTTPSHSFLQEAFPGSYPHPQLSGTTASLKAPPSLYYSISHHRVYVIMYVLPLWGLLVQKTGKLKILPQYSYTSTSVPDTQSMLSKYQFICVFCSLATHYFPKILLLELKIHPLTPTLWRLTPSSSWNSCLEVCLAFLSCTAPAHPQN